MPSPNDGSKVHNPSEGEPFGPRVKSGADQPPTMELRKASGGE